MSRFKGLGSISADATPPPPVPPAAAVAPQVPPVLPAEASTPTCDPRFLVPHLERFMVPLRTYSLRMGEFYASLPSVRQYLEHIDKGIREGALALGLQNQWDSVAAMEKRIDLLVLRSVPNLEFDKAVAALEARYRNLLNAMNETIPGSQGSLL